jgi:hypothetical protein
MGRAGHLLLFKKIFGKHFIEIFGLGIQAPPFLPVKI